MEELKRLIGDLLKELPLVIGRPKILLEKSKALLGNQIGSCKREHCNVEKPCTVCKATMNLYDEIEDWLKRSRL